MMKKVLSLVALLALAHVVASVDVEDALMKRDLFRSLFRSQTAAIPPSDVCAKVAEDIIFVEKAWRGKHNNKREDTCGTVAHKVWMILTDGKYKGVNMINDLDATFSSGNPTPKLKHSLPFCDKANTQKLCTCAHNSADNNVNCATHFEFLLDKPGSIYVFYIHTDPTKQDQAAHWGVLYVSPSGKKAYIFQAFAQLHPLEITTTTPAAVMNAFNLMVNKHTPHAATKSELNKLKIFDAHQQAYLDAIVHVRIAGPFSSEKCAGLTGPTNKAVGRNKICQVLSSNFFTKFTVDDCTK